MESDETPQWAADWIVEWYGEDRVHEPHFGEIIAPARENKPEARPGLLRLVRDRQDTGPIVRATAASLLAGYPGEDTVEALSYALTDEDPHVRSSAIEALAVVAAPEQLLRLTTPLLSDDRRNVRIEAARVLAQFREDLLTEEQQLARAIAIGEYVDAQMLAAEQPAAHLNLGVLQTNLGRADEAFSSYQTALRLEPNFHQARFNLAMLEYQLGDRKAAEAQLREVIDRTDGDLADAWYSLGLLVAEDPARLDEAVSAFKRAVRTDPTQAVHHYHYGISLMQAERWGEAEKALLESARLSPRDPGIAYALVSLYFQRQNWDATLEWIDRLAELDPENPQWPQLRDQIELRQLREDGSGG